MDVGGKFRADPHRHVLKNHRAAGIRLQLHRLLVPDAETGGVLRGQVDMALCYDDPLRERDPAALPHDHRAGASGDVPGQPHGGVDAQRPGVGEGNLHLRFLPFRPQHRHIPQFSLGADDRDPLI